MLKAYKYRIYPTSDQTEKLNQHFGCTRHVYNWALAAKKRHYDKTGESLSRRQLQDMLVASKREEKPWLKEVNSQSLLTALQHLDTAFSNFFRGQARFPRFKQKNSGWQAFQCPQHVSVNFETGRISLPKIAGIRAVLHRPFVGKIKTVTVKLTPSGKYFASVLVDDSHDAPVPANIVPDQTIGLDLGLTHYLIDSTGHKENNPKHLTAALKQLAREQRKLSRMKKGSVNRSRQKAKVARIHEKVGNRRYDFIHQTTAKLIDESQATSFAVETLHIKGMIRNGKLAKAIADSGWGMFLQTLAYKCGWSGRNLLKIDQFAPSSKRCSGCGCRLEKLPLSVRSWTCPDCGQHNDRDINAAINIKEFALAEALGQSVCVKSSPAARHDSACAAAKGAGQTLRHGSQEAPTIAALAV